MPISAASLSLLPPFFFSSRRRHTMWTGDWSSDVCSSDLGLAPLFDRVETPREKDVDAYRRLVRDAELDPSLTFMIGNSPRSDINPAVAAGLRAVFIPHPHTWELEHEEINEAGDRIIELSSFRRLVEVF